MLIAILTVLVMLSAFIQIRAEYHGPRYHVYVCKPLTMLFILVIAARAGPPGGSLYQCAIIAGLACSLAGDILLMLPSDRFTAGLVSFLIAHLFYIAAFVRGAGFRASLWLLLPFIIYGTFMLGILAPHLDKMRLPVLVYMAVILLMAWQAWARWERMRGHEALLASLGAVLFLISDSALAVNRFRGRYGSASAVVLSTYFTGQYLIALSVH